MVEDQQPFEEEDPLTEADEWLAAEVRQLFRAQQAEDAKAVEVAMFYLTDFLTRRIVATMCRLQDPSWNTGWRAWFAGLQRSFDGLSAAPDYPSPGRLRLRGELCWVSGQERYYEPFDFEIQLCPQTGALRGYVVRFADHRPLAEKVLGSATSGVPVGDWAFNLDRQGGPYPTVEPGRAGEMD